MAYVIRPFRAEDAQALADITLAAIHSVCAAAYSSAQVEAWASRHPGAERLRNRAEGGALLFVATDDADQPVAYSLLESDGHLDMLYCHPDHTRRGLADELLAAAEERARDSGLDRLFTEASDLARPTFERAGYVVKHRRDFEIEGPNGSVPIHNYAMEKRLA